MTACLAVGLSSYAQKKTTPQKGNTQTSPAKTAPAQKKPAAQKPAVKKPAPQPTNAKIESLKKERTQIQQQIKQQESALKANKADVQKRLVDLMALNSEIETKQQNINTIEVDINKINSSIDILSAQLETLQKQLDDRKRKYAHSLRFMTRHSSFQDRLMFIFSASNFTQMYRRLRFIKEYADFQKAQGELLQAKKAQVFEKQSQLEEAKSKKKGLLHSDKKARAALETQQADQQVIVAELQKQQTVIQGIIEEDKAKRSALDQKIDQLVTAEIARVQKEAAEKAAKEKAKREAEAKRKAEELKKKKEAEARERQRQIELAKAEEKRKAEAAAKAKAEAEAAAKAAAEKAKAAADAQAKARAEADRKAAEQKAREAEQRAREAEAQRVAMERKAAVEAQRAEKEVEKAKEESAVAMYTSNDQQLSSNFESNKGRLPIPITGTYRIVSHFGQYNVEGLAGVKLDNKGINILGTAGCQARSIFDGEVSAVANVGGTMLVMVRHGRYISVYCNLSSVSVSKGQKVSARQTLGTVGQDNILQFQLRKETAKINPEAWLGR